MKDRMNGKKTYLGLIIAFIGAMVIVTTGEVMTPEEQEVWYQRLAGGAGGWETLMLFAGLVFAAYGRIVTNSGSEQPKMHKRSASTPMLLVAALTLLVGCSGSLRSDARMAAYDGLSLAGLGGDHEEKIGNANKAIEIADRMLAFIDEEGGVDEDKLFGFAVSLVAERFGAEDEERVRLAFRVIWNHVRAQVNLDIPEDVAAGYREAVSGLRDGVDHYLADLAMDELRNTGGG